MPHPLTFSAVRGIFKSNALKHTERFSGGREGRNKTYFGSRDFTNKKYRYETEQQIKTFQQLFKSVNKNDGQMKIK